MFLAGLARLLLWALRWLVAFFRKYPLIAIGFSFFVIGFFFIAYNAIFAQTYSRRSVVFLNNSSREVTTDSLKKRTSDGQADLADDGPVQPPQAMQPREESTQDHKRQDAVAELISKSVDREGMTARTRTGTEWFDENSLERKQEIRENGATQNPGGRHNEQYLGLINSAANNLPTSNSASVEPSHEPISDTHDVADSDENIIRKVQSALRSFGNNNVNVLGKMDAATVDALKSFQKIFSLSETGTITPELVKKMREIGLMS